MNAAATAADLRGALEAVVGSAHVQRPPASLVRRGDVGAWLVQPGSASEVAELIAVAGRLDVAIIPIGSGARAAASTQTGALGARPRVFVDSRRLCHVLHLDETSLVVHVQAGLTALALERILAPRGL